MPQGKEIMKMMIEKEFFRCKREFGETTLKISDNQQGKNK